MYNLEKLPPQISFNLSQAIVYPHKCPISKLKDVKVYRVLGIEGLYISTYNFFEGSEIDENLIYYVYEGKKFYMWGEYPLELLKEADVDFLLSYFKNRFRMTYRRKLRDKNK